MPLRVLTDAGLHNIAHHKYKGGAYTPLDTLLNPFWTWCTTLLPLWMAPNLVTLIALAHGVLAYLVLSFYTPWMCGEPPSWTYLLSCYCIWAYQTLDCMDGKQARRTGSSSPLGQLFDHGCDAAVNVAFHAILMSCVAPPCEQESFRLNMLTLAWFQALFLIAQWQEYHTSILPTGFGPLGVTEAHWAIVGACLTTYASGGLPNSPIALTAGIPLVGHMSPKILLAWFAICILASMCACGILSTFLHKDTNILVAVKQLVSPALVLGGAVMWGDDILARHARLLQVVTGVLIIRLTVEFIVCSMARQEIQTFNPLAVAYAIVCAMIEFEYLSIDGGMPTVALLFLSLVVFADFVQWTHGAITQICYKLDIQCFRIPPPKRE